MFPVAKCEKFQSMWIISVEMCIKVYASYPVAKGQELAKAKLDDFMAKVKIEAPSTIGLVRGEKLRLV